jgi:hypothetical protein
MKNITIAALALILNSCENPREKQLQELEEQLEKNKKIREETIELQNRVKENELKLEALRADTLNK